MTDFHVRHGETASLDRVDGNLRVGKHAEIRGANGKSVIVTGCAYFEGNADIDCDFECNTLECQSGKLQVNGNLTVHKRLDVGHSIEVRGMIKAEDIDVGGTALAGSIICSRLRVGGYAQVNGIFEAKTVDVGGKVYAPGTVKLGDLHVGGEAEIGGGSITGNIQVGGHFSAKAPLEFGDLQVYGRGRLPADTKGKRISAYGKLTIDGNFTCSKLEVGGSIEIEGSCYADKVEVGGRLKVARSLFVVDRLEGYGHIEIGGNLESSALNINGKLEAQKATVKEEASVSGKMETREGLKAKVINVRGGTKCEGPLIGEQVEVGKSQDLSYGTWGAPWQGKIMAMGWGGAVTDDIYAHEVAVGPASKVGRIFADTVKLEQGSVTEQVTYTSELKTDFGVSIREPPQKVSNLPAAPF